MPDGNEGSQRRPHSSLTGTAGGSFLGWVRRCTTRSAAPKPSILELHAGCLLTSDDQIRFMVNIQRLLDEGLFTASYRLLAPAS
jgi:hypothetical protein